MTGGISVRVYRKGSLCVLLLVVFTPLFVFLFVELISIRSYVPHHTTLSRLQNVFSVVRTNESFV